MRSLGMTISVRALGMTLVARALGLPPRASRLRDDLNGCSRTRSRSFARALAAFALLALVAGCSGPSNRPEASLEQQIAAVQRSRAVLATHVGQTALMNACEAPEASPVPVPTPSPAPLPAPPSSALSPRNLLVVALTAEQCLSCRSVGFFMRELLRRERDGGRPERVVVVAPSADVSTLCTYFGRERARVPVLGAAASFFPDSAITTDVLVFRIDSSGTAGAALHAREPKDLLPVLARDARGETLAAGEGKQVTPPLRRNTR